MSIEMPPSPSEILRQVKSGDAQALGVLLEQYRDRLRRMVALHLDRRLQGRVDASDVVQEGFLAANQRIDEYTHDPSVPFYIWLRFVVRQEMLNLHREHLEAQIRDVRREMSLRCGPTPEASSAALAAALLGKLTSPSQAAIRAEREIRLQEALNAMDPIDRQILILRHYEKLTNEEAASDLGLNKSATSKRYTRALIRLKNVLFTMPGGLSEGGR